jgi:hypothetical protein
VSKPIWLLVSSLSDIWAGKGGSGKTRFEARSTFGDVIEVIKAFFLGSHLSNQFQQHNTYAAPAPFSGFQTSRLCVQSLSV